MHQIYLPPAMLANRQFFLQLLISLILVVVTVHTAHADSSNTEVQALASTLIKAKFKQKITIVGQLEEKAADNETILPLLQALLAGELFYTKKEKQLVYAEKLENKNYQITSVFVEGEPQEVSKKDIKKVKTNNKLRGILRSTLAKLTLFSKRVEDRKAAVESLMAKPAKDNIELLKKAQKTETDKEVRSIIDTALAVTLLDSDDAQVRLSAIKVLDGNLQPIVKNRLEKLLEKNFDLSYKETNPAVIRAAKSALSNIEAKITFYGYLERLFFGISLGSVLLLVAAGLAITFGVMGVINMAHGEMIMLGAYTTYVIQLLLPNNLALSILISIPAAFMVSACVGIMIERGVIQFLKGRPLETLLATFGISLILQQLVRTIFSPLNRQVATPEFMSGAMEINPIFSITYNRLYILIFALLVFFALQLILKKTSLGLNVRAVSQNRAMAKCMGIKTEWVDAMTFGLGSGVAGLAGVALSQITNVGPNLGQAYIIDSFMVVVFGGVGNLWGTLVGGFSLGILNKFLEPATGSVLANIIVLVGIILFIQKRPKGLFPQKGRAAE